MIDLIREPEHLQLLGGVSYVGIASAHAEHRHVGAPVVDVADL